MSHYVSCCPLSGGDGRLQQVDLSSGTVLHHRYVVTRRLGSGGMGASYLALDQMTGLQVALKVLEIDSPELLVAFRAEFQVLCGLIHPNLCEVHDFARARLDSGEEIHFYSSSYIDGRTLDQVARGRSWSDVSQAVTDVIEALCFLHQLGFLHGDVKPRNVMVGADGRGVLIDLGCSRRLGEVFQGEFAGTPGYLAPEWLAGRRADQRADLYALGVTLREIGEVLSEPLPIEIDHLAKRLSHDDVARRPADAREVLEVFGFEPPELVLPGGFAARLVGRDHEMELFSDFLSRLIGGVEGPRGLVITGSEGIGRSRLLREMKWTAQMRCPVVEASAIEDQPVTSALRRAVLDPTLPRGLDGLLRARSHLPTLPEPVILLFDDVPSMSETQRRLLVALLRSLEARDRLGVVVVLDDAPELSSDVVSEASLSPLSPEAVAEWTEGLIPTGKVSEITRLTGGYPASIQSLLVRLPRGEWSREDLSELVSSPLSSSWLTPRLEALSPEARETLTLFAVLDGEIEASDVARLGLSRTILGSLLREGWIVRAAGGWRLLRPSESSSIRAEVEPEMLRDAHGAVIETLRIRLGESSIGERMRAELTARIVFHLVEVGDVDEASSLFSASPELRRMCPKRWVRAVEAIVSAAAANIETVLTAAEVLESAGRPERALELLGGVSESSLEDDQRGLLQERLGACKLKLDDVESSLGHLIRADALHHSPERRARTADLISRTLIQRGAYDEAMSRAEGALSLCSDPAISADLEDDIGVAASYLGDLERAREHLRIAAELHRSIGRDPRALVRSCSYRALNEYRAGDVEAAAEGYAEALGVAEKNGLSDEVANAALNLGTACHQRGDWGKALESYERGLPTASALGLLSIEAVLKLNLAKLYADIGLLERSDEHVARARSMTRNGGLRFMDATLDAVAADVFRARGDRDRARTLLESARLALSEQQALREVAEIEIDLAWLEIDAGDNEAARGAIAAAGASSSQVDASDLVARLLMVRGLLSSARGDHDRGRASLDEAARMAETLDQKSLCAEVEMALGDVHERQGAKFLARRHRIRAREIWERICSSLPAHMHEAFWAHFRRAPVKGMGLLDPEGDPARDSSAGRGTLRKRQLEKLLETYRRLNSSLEIGEVLSRAMDAAIELTRAERGFLLLVGEEDGQLEVGVARNLDRERLGRSHFKFSKSIAERVIATGNPIVTVDAGSDQRFPDKTSIHAMRLKSVISVPIVAPSGVQGALYLDNRFQRGRFEENDLEMMMAFADHVALALSNARLHDTLERRTRELERERQRVEELLRGQTRQINELVEEVRVKQRVLEHRYDYGNIVGQSAAMHDVFTMLDRIIDSTTTVLIQGESGTGKELIARTIHYNGPRKNGPFVAVNCVELPESLLEAELFGHVRGAFTGAERDREGLLSSANEGTFFLDEVGEMPLGMQTKLLRVLEQRTVRPLGSARDVPIDIRLVCATNRLLHEEVVAGRFREDLYYRLGVVEVTMPPLRERIEDVPPLLRYFLERIVGEQGVAMPELPRETLRYLLTYHWPGNIRQLENVVTKAMLLSSGDRLEPSDFDLPTRRLQVRRARHRGEFEEEEAETILTALRTARWNVSEVSRRLGIPRATLYRKMQRYGLRRER